MALLAKWNVPPNDCELFFSFTPEPHKVQTCQYSVLASTVRDLTCLGVNIHVNLFAARPTSM